MIGRQVAERVAVKITNLVQTEAATRGKVKCGGQQLGRVKAGQSHTRPQVRLGIGLQVKPTGLYGFAQPHGRQHIVQRLAGTHMHQHAAGRHQTYAGAVGHLLQLLQTQRVVEVLQKLNSQPTFRAKKPCSPNSLLGQCFCIDSAWQRAKNHFAVCQE